MRIVDVAAVYPMKCAVSARTQGPFVDTGCEDDYGQLIYLHVDVARQAGGLAGMGDVKELEGLLEEARSRIAELEAEIEEVAAERDEAVRFLDAIDVLESKDFRARKKTGRPKKEVTDGVE